MQDSIFSLFSNRTPTSDGWLRSGRSDDQPSCMPRSNYESKIVSTEGFASQMEPLQYVPRPKQTLEKPTYTGLEESTPRPLAISASEPNESTAGSRSLSLYNRLSSFASFVDARSEQLVQADQRKLPSTHRSSLSAPDFTGFLSSQYQGGRQRASSAGPSRFTPVSRPLQKPLSPEQSTSKQRYTLYNNNSVIPTHLRGKNPRSNSKTRRNPYLIKSYWEEQNTSTFAVEADGISVVRRADNDMINGTKLFNTGGANMTRGKRDGLLKGTHGRVVVKHGSMHLKGVWIPFQAAKDHADALDLTSRVFPLFEEDLDKYAVSEADARNGKIPQFSYTSECAPSSAEPERQLSQSSQPPQLRRFFSNKSEPAQKISRPNSPVTQSRTAQSAPKQDASAENNKSVTSSSKPASSVKLPMSNNQASSSTTSRPLFSSTAADLAEIMSLSAK